MIRRLLLILAPLLLMRLLPSDCRAAASPPSVEPLFVQYCHSCHGPTNQKGKLRLDQLDYDLVRGPHADRWKEVLDRLGKGEMPPEGEPQPTLDERQALTRWLSAGLQEAALARSKVGTDVVLRRMNREQYSHTLGDLLGVPVDVAAVFPPEGPSADGFTNNGQTLGMSPVQVEYYLKTARQMLSKAIVTGPPPQRYHYRLAWQNRTVVEPKGAEKKPVEKKVLTLSAQTLEIPKHLAAEHAKKPGIVMLTMSGKNLPQQDGSDFVLLSPATPAPGGSDIGTRQGPVPALTVRVRDFAGEGEARIRVRASSVPDAAGRNAWLHVFLGNRLDDGIEFKPVGRAVEVSATPRRPETYEFRARLENFPLPFAQKDADNGEYGQLLLGVWNAYGPAPKEGGPVLRVESVEIEGPVYDEWPPASHRRIFIESPTARDEDVYVREVLRAFMDRAYRRPAATEEIEQVARLWKRLRPEAESFEASVRDVLPAVLASPRFLYLVEPQQAAAARRPLTAHELASRLSYFLSGSMPDDELFRLAASGSLRDPKVLAAQVERLIDDPKVDRFADAFTREWLELDAIDRVAVSVPGAEGYYNKDLEQSLREEPKQFFREVLRSNLSSLNFLDSDFVTVNPTLAKHYGIPDISGPYFRRVALGPARQRGGLLTQGVMLVGQSNGKESHPIRRAVWLKKRLFNDPPPPPPPNVAELDEANPATANLSLAKRLEAHRNHAACAACHRNIDPWGLPFEQYDALGRWREPGKSKDKAVEASSTLPDGTAVNGVGELRAYLLKHKRDEFARALVSKLLAYALGRSLSLGDGPTVDRLTREFAADGYRLRPLLTAIVTTELFTTR